MFPDVLLTILMLLFMFNPYHNEDYDFPVIYRILWLVPIVFVWTTIAFKG